jgi:hypothetical protein
VLERLQNSKGPFVLFGRDEEIDRDEDIEGTTLKGQEAVKN